jgi:hypothetical protein
MVSGLAIIAWKLSHSLASPSGQRDNYRDPVDEEIPVTDD